MFSPKDDKSEELRKFCLQRAELITDGLTVEALIRIAEKLYQYIITGEVPGDKKAIKVND